MFCQGGARAITREDRNSLISLAKIDLFTYLEILGVVFVVQEKESSDLALNDWSRWCTISAVYESDVAMVLPT